MAKIITEVSTISEVKPHPNADRLDLCVVRGWQCVTGRGQYKVGDKVVYFQPDTCLPKEWTDKFGVTKYCSEKEQGMRIRSAALRGEFSHGLIVDPADPEWEVGMDVSDYYGAVKYIPPIKAGGGDIDAGDPMFIKYTEVENIRNHPSAIPDGTLVAYTEKLHGCVSEDTKIMKPNGEEISISEVQPGDLILSYADGKFIPMLVKNVLIQPMTEELKWFELIFDNGRKLKCTEDHPILTTRGWVIASELESCDDIISV